MRVGLDVVGIGGGLGWFGGGDDDINVRDGLEMDWIGDVLGMGDVAIDRWPRGKVGWKIAEEAGRGDGR